ncbi:MAG: HAMP domain-containing sensor histidine kinase [Bacillota bacterium]|nr:HAMP domain-containing sensor histidine kinase [Bacillota bacterium]
MKESLFHIRWKLVLWGLIIVVVATFLASFFATQFSVLIYARERGPFILWLSNILTPLFFVILSTLMMIFTSKSMVNRILVLSDAAKQIASGNFNVEVTEIDRSDEIYQLAQDFNLMARELQRTEYLRKDFISSVSHEIKTPLSVIQGYSDLLAGDGLSEEERKEYAGVICRESRRLLNMCSNMLQISRLEKEEIPGKQSLYRLDEQLRQAILLLEPKWTEKSLALELSLEECRCFGNEELLQQVWINLLDNAIKFSRNGGAVSIKTEPVSDGLCVVIADRGPGMDQETRLRAFEQFYQGEQSRAGEGCGLGLSIVKRIVELHRGRIEVESAPGKGSAFTVFLPRDYMPGDSSGSSGDSVRSGDSGGDSIH